MTGVTAARNVLLVYPRFEYASFWGLEATCEIAGKRRYNPPLGLITIAALLPPDWPVRLIDRNVEDLRDADVDWADLVLTGGLIPQRPDTLWVVERCRARGTPAAVGGPDVTSSPQAFAVADFRVRGEAEGVLAAFLDAWLAGATSGEFSAEKYTVDVAASPLPRFELLDLSHYISMAVQFSRGCPFTCEFCDIIELYGRVPRTKTTAQMLGELEALYRLGHRGPVDFVDDNLIGNKKAVKAFLPHLAAWQKEHRYPFVFNTQASVNLADDAALLGLMRDANFRMIFIGIESPDPDTLISAQKKQNADRELTENIHAIYRAGMAVHAGFIVGFDGEREGVAEGMIDCIESAALPVCMAGMLTALPETQLSRRLTGEGRLQPEQDFDFFRNVVAGDQCTQGLNFDTARPRRDILDDYRTILDTIYRPQAFFRRVRTVARLVDLPRNRASFSASAVLNDMRSLGRFLVVLATRRRDLALPFLRTALDCAIHNPAALKIVVGLAAMYLHVGAFSRQVAAHIESEVAAIDRGEIVPRRHAAPPAAKREAANTIGRIAVAAE